MEIAEAVADVVAMEIVAVVMVTVDVVVAPEVTRAVRCRKAHEEALVTFQTAPEAGVVTGAALVAIGEHTVAVTEADEVAIVEASEVVVEEEEAAMEAKNHR